MLGAYDKLLQTRDDPIVRVNRVVALAEVQGPTTALQELEQLHATAMDDFLPYYAVRADLLARLGRNGDAIVAYHKVLALAPFPSERRWIERKLAQMESAGSSAAKERGVFV